MVDPKRIHILSPGLDQAVVIAEILKRHHQAIELVGVRLPGDDPVRARRHYDRILELSDPGLSDLSRTVIPTGARSTRYVLEQQDVTIGRVTLTQGALRAYDKCWMLAQAAEAGLPVPTTWQDVAQLSGFPVFYKQRFERGSGARGIARTHQDIPDGERDHLIYQELIESQGTYGVGFLADNGDMLTSFNHYERESLPKEGGSAVIVERVEESRLTTYAQRLLRALNYSGWGLMEFKYCPRRDDFVFMEINAKFWASCEFAFRNEPQFLHLLFDIDAPIVPVQRMLFLDRAFARGLPFVFGRLDTSLTGTALRVYPGWARRIAVGMLPTAIRKQLKQALCAIRT